MKFENYIDYTNWKYRVDEEIETNMTFTEYENKNVLDETKKAQWYLNRLIEHMESDAK